MSKTTNYELEKYDDNTNCDFRFINGSLDKIDEKLKKVSDKADKREIIIKNVVMKLSSLVHDGMIVPGGPKYHRYIYKDVDIAYRDVVDINFEKETILKGYTQNILPVTDCYDITLCFYSLEELTNDLIATIIIYKGGK